MNKGLGQLLEMIRQSQALQEPENRVDGVVCWRRHPDKFGSSLRPRWIPTRSATPSPALVPQRKSGFPFRTPRLLLGFQGTKTASARLEYRAPSVTPGLHFAPELRPCAQASQRQGRCAGAPDAAAAVEQFAPGRHQQTGLIQREALLGMPLGLAGKTAGNRRNPCWYSGSTSRSPISSTCRTKSSRAWQAH